MSEDRREFWLVLNKSAAFKFKLGHLYKEGDLESKRGFGSKWKSSGRGDGASSDDYCFLNGLVGLGSIQFRKLPLYGVCGLCFDA